MAWPLDGKVPQKAGPEDGVTLRTSDGIDTRPKYLVLLDRVLRRWTLLSLERRFLIAALLSVGLSMLTLGYWVEKQIRAGWLQGMAETGAVYLEAILSPHLQILDASSDLPDAQRQSITALLSDTRLSGRVAMIKIWNLRGQLLFSTGDVTAGEVLSPPLLKRVKAGLVSVEMEMDTQGRHSPFPASLLEIYAPMYKRGTREIIAIGEFYEFSRSLESEVKRVKVATWFLIINVAVFIGILLYVAAKRTSRIIAAQQALLERNLERAAALAKRNNILRRSADQARLRAAVLNENYLARVGADLHDGPIQMLSLMMLKIPNTVAAENHAVADKDRELKSLIEDTLADLRNLSAGLVLPELKERSLSETIDLVVTRHEQQTGTPVSRTIGDLPERVPEAVQVCVYRIIQEALTNAYKHAGGAGQSVAVHSGDRMLIVTISDSGGAPPAKSKLTQVPSLGLRGMEARVESLRGRFSIVRKPSGGAEVEARIPLQVRA